MLKAETLAAMIQRNTDRHLAGETSREDWTASQRALWDHVDASGVRREVCAILVPFMGAK